MTKKISKENILTIIAFLICSPLIFSSIQKMLGAEQIIKNFEIVGIAPEHIIYYGITQFLCCTLYILPQTKKIGLLLISSYLGGGVLFHILMEKSMLPPLCVLLIIWILSYYRIEKK